MDVRRVKQTAESRGQHKEGNNNQEESIDEPRENLHSVKPATYVLVKLTTYDSVKPTIHVLVKLTTYDSVKPTIYVLVKLTTYDSVKPATYDLVKPTI